MHWPHIRQSKSGSLTAFSIPTRTLESALDAREESEEEFTPSGKGRHPSSESRYDTGIRLSGSTNGIGATVAIRRPHSLSTRTFEPSLASSVGTQQ